MKKSVLFILMLGFLAGWNTAQARDTKLLLSVNEAMRSPQAKEVLNPSIKLHFASGGGKTIRRGVVSNKKTNAFGKSDEAACQWAFLSAVKALQKRAVKEGGRRVVNVVSYYKKNTYRSRSLYECHAGAVVAGVALKGDIVR